MQNTHEIAPKLHWVGGNERRLQRFENLFPLRFGVAYNSYLIVDEKTCLLDTVDSSISQLYIDNVEAVLNGRNLDYLVVNHMEPIIVGILKQLFVVTQMLNLLVMQKHFSSLNSFMILTQRKIT